MLLYAPYFLSIEIQDLNSEQLLDFALDKVDDMKARDIVKLDVKEVSSVTD